MKQHYPWPRPRRPLRNQQHGIGADAFLDLISDPLPGEGSQFLPEPGIRCQSDLGLRKSSQYPGPFPLQFRPPSFPGLWSVSARQQGPQNRSCRRHHRGRPQQVDRQIFPGMSHPKQKARAQDETSEKELQGGVTPGRRAPFATKPTTRPAASSSANPPPASKPPATGAPSRTTKPGTPPASAWKTRHSSTTGAITSPSNPTATPATAATSKESLIPDHQMFRHHSPAFRAETAAPAEML